MDNQKQGQLVAGGVLVVLGIGLLALQFVEGFGDAVFFFFLGGLFVAGYLYRRKFGLLIPGGILLGLGLGRLGEGGLFEGDGFGSIGLGIGFISIYVIALVYQRDSHWWPLIPGAVLVLRGISQNNAELDALLKIGWPLILVVVGLIVLAGAFGLTGRKAAEESTSSEDLTTE